LFQGKREEEEGVRLRLELPKGRATARARAMRVEREERRELRKSLTKAHFVCHESAARPVLVHHKRHGLLLKGREGEEQLFREAAR
jgi:hypothetical protein